ncbi:hypothetical protein HZ326_25615 [Fusarium oxysporum f. sp. albedinis]|nr:hypothetical protein HZ326_25615 [Fusarium oxysporum f. sp. albedinis]
MYNRCRADSRSDHLQDLLDRSRIHARAFSLSVKHVPLDINTVDPRRASLQQRLPSSSSSISSAQRRIYFQEVIPSAGSIPLQPRILLHR